VTAVRTWAEVVSRARLLVLVFGCAAPALFIGLLLYVKFSTEGWGALAFAPLFFPLFVASAAAAALGGLLYVAHVRKRPRDLPLATVVCLNVLLLWYVTTHR
jgi:hypothetical protein